MRGSLKRTLLSDPCFIQASLGHKACHSFTPNARFDEIYHARFGNIMSVVAKRDIRRHEEILVSYNYTLSVAPEW